MGKAIAAIVIGILILIGGILYAATRHPAPANTTTSTATSSPSPSPTASPSPSPSPATSGQNTAATASVTIENFAFSPATLTVKKGTTVTWTNKDSTAHTVTESDGQDGPKSSQLGSGQTYSFTYNTVGTFPYKCSIHPHMTGTVTVTQ